MTEADRKVAEAAALVFLYGQEQRQAATEGTRKARAILQGLEQRGKVGKAGYIALIRSIAGRARKDEKARRLIRAALERAHIPQDCAEVFSAYYLEGDRRPPPREFMRRFYITPRTAYRRNIKVLEAMLVPLFGVDGLFLEAPPKQTQAKGKQTEATAEQSQAPEAAGSVTP